MMLERQIHKKKAAKTAVGTRERILRAAVKEFAAKGLSGGRLETICAVSRVNIRMIYHYFGSKEGLYIAVLEEDTRRAEEGRAQACL